jgi:peptide deformylase
MTATALTDMKNPDWLVRAPDPALQKKCKLVEEFAPISACKKFLDDKANFVRQNNHYGISAPQFGVEVRIFYINEDRFNKGGWFINPYIIARKGKSAKVESCLSVDGQYRVTRSTEILAGWQDESGEHHKNMFRGMLSRAFQHELDHLNGITIPYYPIRVT